MKAMYTRKGKRGEGKKRGEEGRARNEKGKGRGGGLKRRKTRKGSMPKHFWPWGMCGWMGAKK